MTEERISVQIGPRPRPPETADLTALVATLLDRYFDECAGDTNPSSQGFGMFLMKQRQVYDHYSDF